MKDYKKFQSKIDDAISKYNVDFLYLFGSQVTGKIGPDSDYDFAIMLSDDMDKNERFLIRCKMIEDFQKILNKKVDLVVLNDIRSILFKFIIIKEGELLFNRNAEKRMDFEVSTMSNYYDFAPFLKAYDEAFLKKIMAYDSDK